MGMCSQNEHTGQLQKTKCPTEESRKAHDETDWEWIRNQPKPWLKKKEEKEESLVPEGVRFP